MTDPETRSPERTNTVAAGGDAARLLATLDAVLHELRGAEAPRAGMDDELERTLGIDSLARMALMQRLDGIEPAEGRPQALDQLGSRS